MENKDNNQNSSGNEQEIDAIKKKEFFDLYVLWCSIPALMTSPPQQKNGMVPKPRDFAMGMGIEDEQLLDLIDIKTSTEFGERYHLNKNTLTDWKKIIKDRRLNGFSGMRDWALDMSKNMLMSLYNHGMKKGNPLTMKLWFQIVNEWSEKSEVEHKFIPVRTIKIKSYDATDIRTIEGERPRLEADEETGDSI